MGYLPPFTTESPTTHYCTVQHHVPIDPYAERMPRADCSSNVGYLPTHNREPYDPGRLGGRPSVCAAKSMSRTALLPGDFPSPWTASSASFPAHRRPYDLNRLPSGADRPLRALEHLHHEWPGMALERQPGHTWRHAASREASLARPWWSGKTAPAQRRRGNPHYHKLTAASCVRFKQLGEASCALCPLTRSAPLQPHASAPLDRCRARTPAGESVC